MFEFYLAFRFFEVIRGTKIPIYGDCACALVIMISSNHEFLGEDSLQWPVKFGWCFQEANFAIFALEEFRATVQPLFCTLKRSFEAQARATARSDLLKSEFVPLTLHLRRKASGFLSSK